MSEPPKFLNLDVVLKSNSDLGTLVRHLDQDERVFVLSHQEFAGQSQLVLELTLEEAPEVRSYTQHFLTIIDQLPDPMLELWKACSSRGFDYGFEGGNEYPTLEARIPADLLIQIGRIGADIGITVYPYGSYD